VGVLLSERKEERETMLEELQAFDTDGDGTIGWKEFLNAMRECVHRMHATGSSVASCLERRLSDVLVVGGVGCGGGASEPFCHVS
jgi:hypothetical protein